MHRGFFIFLKKPKSLTLLVYTFVLCIKQIRFSLLMNIVAEEDIFRKQPDSAQVRERPGGRQHTY